MGAEVATPPGRDVSELIYATVALNDPFELNRSSMQSFRNNASDRGEFKARLWSTR